MKTQNSTSLIGRLFTKPVWNSVLGVLIAAVSLTVNAQQERAPIRNETVLVEPLAGRDYSMRIDLAAARFERYDGDVTVVESITLPGNCRTEPASGLWLAVTGDTPHSLRLLPLGLTDGEALQTDTHADCRDSALALPPSVLERIAANGGGVIYVDRGDAQLDPQRGLARQVQ
ncbi:MAG: hypothetical protein ABI411_08210 [Tahibacter sp.]